MTAHDTPIFGVELSRCEQALPRSADSGNADERGQHMGQLSVEAYTARVTVAAATSGVVFALQLRSPM